MFNSNRTRSGTNADTTTSSNPSALFALITLDEGYAIFISISMFAFIGAKLSIFVRSRVCNDKGNIDANFDAGGKASAGMIATAVVSHWTWGTTFMHSSAKTTKFGISGPFWYACGGTLQLFIFALVIVQFKICAPGAKTFLQVIKARFGRTAHIVFCVYAISTNVLITAMLMLGGTTALTNLVDGFTMELATFLMAAMISSYTFMGGLSAVIYVSYWNTAVMMILMIVFAVKILYVPGPDNQIGSIKKLFTVMNSSTASDSVGNMDNSFLTMSSTGGLLLGLFNIVSLEMLFMDQSFWQCALAARPKQAVTGFLMGAITWFAIPFTFATVVGMAYMVLGAEAGHPLLSATDDQELIAPIVAHKLMGRIGEVMLVLMVIIAITSTGSAEVVAVTSIIIYDIYQLYLKPYRLVFDASTCVLCGHERGHNATIKDKCNCISMTFCKACIADDEDRSRCSWKRAIKPIYTCSVHGQFRNYNDYLCGLKNWCQIFTTIGILPLMLIINATGVSQDWLFTAAGIPILSPVIPLVLCFFWTRLTSLGLIAGTVGGSIISCIVWMSYSAVQPGGLSNFYASTGQSYPVLAGELTALFGGGIISVIISVITSRGADKSLLLETWERTLDIDNPLRPWTEVYAKELGLKKYNLLSNRPSMNELEQRYRRDKWLSIVVATGLIFMFGIVWPLATFVVGVMDLTRFTQWMQLVVVYGFLATIFIVIVPIVTELYEIKKVLTEKNSIESSEIEFRDDLQLVQIAHDSNATKLLSN